MDDKNIGLLKNLYGLRQVLDIYCLIAANQESINKEGLGEKFFSFLRNSCINLIVLNICKIYEYEKNYELNSIEGVLKHINSQHLPILDSSCVYAFINRYGHVSNESDLLSGLSSTFESFKEKYKTELERFKNHRDKHVTHSEYGFKPSNLPSYDVMECMYGFGADFYMLVSRVFVSTPAVSVVPCDLNSNREVKDSLIEVFDKLGFKDVKTELE